MKKTIKLIVCLVLMAAMLMGCSASEEFSYSNYLDENGYFKDIKALDYVDLPHYNNMPFDKSLVEVTDEEIKVQLDSILEQEAEVEEITDRAVEDGDTINIVYEGKIDGVAFEGGSTGEKGTEVTIGETQYIDDFLEQVKGHMPGETFDVEVTFPEGYDAENKLSGKDAVFTCTVSYIHGEKNIPELTDEIAKKYEFDTVEELTEDISNWLKIRKRNEIVNSIISLAKIEEVPESVMEYVVEDVISMFRKNAEEYGMSMDQYFQLGGFENEEAYVEQNKSAFEAQAKLCLTIQAIAEAEGVVTTDADIEKYEYTEYVESHGQEYANLIVMQNELVPEVLISKINLTESAE